MPVIKATATAELLMRKKRKSASKKKNKITDTRKRSIRKILRSKDKN